MRRSDIDNLNIELYQKSQEIEVLQRNENTKDDVIAALSDKLQDFVQEVENLKKRV
jgi:hypothetical protein